MFIWLTLSQPSLIHTLLKYVSLLKWSCGSVTFTSSSLLLGHGGALIDGHFFKKELLSSELNIPWRNLQSLSVSLHVFLPNYQHFFILNIILLIKDFKKQKRTMAVVIETTIGDFTIDLYTDERPQSE